MTKKNSMTEKKKNVLFICNFNMMRSPTAEEIFKENPQMNVKSAGVEPSAIVPADSHLLEWADIIYVMEERQLDILESKFSHICSTKEIVCLNIPDEYDYMDLELVAMLKQRIEYHWLHQQE